MRSRIDARDDAALVTAYVRGDSAAFRTIWARHVQSVRKTLRRRLGNDSYVEDFVQEVFIVFARSAHRLVDPHALRPYLTSIAIRISIGEWQKRRTRGAFASNPAGVLFDREMTWTDFEAMEAARALARVLDQLSPRKRLAFILRCVDKATVGEVARTLGVSVATAKREIGRSKRLVLRAAQSTPSLRAYAEPVPQHTRKHVPGAGPSRARELARCRVPTPASLPNTSS